MKRLVALSTIIMGICLATPVHALEFWHSGTVWANQGMCSAIFRFDAGEEAIRNLKISVSAIDKAGKKVASDVLEIEQLGQSSADRYAETYLTSEEMCNDDLTIVVNKATAIIDEKTVDLLKTKSLSAQDFKPFKIKIGK